MNWLSFCMLASLCLIRSVASGQATQPAPSSPLKTACMIVPMTVPRYLHTATSLRSGAVLIIGGIVLRTSAELYDPVSGTFSTTGPMATQRHGYSATLLPDGKVLIAGGGSCLGPGDCILDSAEVYDPLAGRFKPTGSMTVERSAHSATRLASGKILIAGGLDNTGQFMTSAELYDPASGTFAPTAEKMHFARGNHSATLLSDGKVLIAGGYNKAAGYLASAEIYDPAAGDFTVVGSMKEARWLATATLLPNGRVLITGGTGAHSHMSSAEIYDPAKRAFTATASMWEGRVLHTATLLPSGQVLVAGGVGGQPGKPVYYSSTELYDPVKEAFSPATEMLTPRSSHTATLLPGGRVLLAGGTNPVGALDTAEIH